MTIKKDCIMYDARRGQSRNGTCKGLLRLYCEKEECAFYKPKSLYTEEGKNKEERFVTPVSQ